MKTVFTLAIAAGALALASVQAHAGQITEYSSTWKPGFSLDDNGQYSKTSYTDEETGYNARAGVENRVETSATAKAGFYLDDASGQYVKSRVVKQPDVAASPRIERIRETWAPGYFITDNGSYVRS